MTSELTETMRLLEEIVTGQGGLKLEPHGLVVVVTEVGKVKEVRYEKLSGIAAIVDAVGTQEHNPEDK